METREILNQIRQESTPQFLAKKDYENALSWVEFYKKNRRKITISRREVARLKATYELSKPILR